MSKDIINAIEEYLVRDLSIKFGRKIKKVVWKADEDKLELYFK